MFSTFVVTKDLSDLVETIELPTEGGSPPQSVEIKDISPADGSLVLDVVELRGTSLVLSITGGDIGIAYGVPIVLEYATTTKIVTVAVSIVSPEFSPTPSVEPTALTELLNSIDAGESAIGTAIFVFPPDVDVNAGGDVTWDLMDDEGVVYGSGQAYEVKIVNNGLSNIIKAKSVITAPTDIPPTIDRPYTLRYTFNFDDQAVYTSESVTVHGIVDIPLGPSDSVWLQGDQMVLQFVTDRLYDQVVMSIADTSIEVSIKSATRIAGGHYLWTAQVSEPLPVDLVPYLVFWSYKQSIHSGIDRETSKLWVVNSSLLMAVDDVKRKVNKARASIYGQPIDLFDVPSTLNWLRRARDAFNSSYGVFTNFTMLNAKGAIREFWLMYAELMSLEAHYLFEGEQAFNFQGANISLDVDRTQFFDSAASKVQQRLDNEFKSVKQVMVMRGCTSGDGSADPSRLAHGAIGAVGISIHAASPQSRFPSTRRY